MILDIIFLAVIIIFIISGAIRGFARAIMNIAAVVASAILSNLLSGVISDWIFNSFVRNDLIANRFARMGVFCSFFFLQPV